MKLIANKNIKIKEKTQSKEGIRNPWLLLPPHIQISTLWKTEFPVCSSFWFLFSEYLLSNSCPHRNMCSALIDQTSYQHITDKKRAHSLFKAFLLTWEELGKCIALWCRPVRVKLLGLNAKKSQAVQAKCKRRNPFGVDSEKKEHWWKAEDPWSIILFSESHSLALHRIAWSIANQYWKHGQSPDHFCLGHISMLLYYLCNLCIRF